MIFYNKPPDISEEEFHHLVDGIEKEMLQIFHILSNEECDEKLYKAQQLLAVMDTLADHSQKAVFISGIISYYDMELSQAVKNSVNLAHLNSVLIDMLKKHGMTQEDVIREMVRVRLSEGSLWQT